jgi:curli biogenesis system outer membrane secretion channel CsgG
MGLWLAVVLTLGASSLALGARNRQGRPSVAVLEFQNKTNKPSTWSGAPRAMQDVFVTELMKRRRFRVVEREQLAAKARQANLTLSGDVDPATAARIGRQLGVNYLLTGAVTEYGVTDRGARGAGLRRGPRAGAPGGRSFVAALNARLIDTSTGEIVWADAVRNQVSVGGFGGGVDDQRMFDRVAKPAIRRLSRSLGTAKF